MGRLTRESGSPVYEIRRQNVINCTIGRVVRPTTSIFVDKLLNLKKKKKKGTFERFTNIFDNVTRRYYIDRTRRKWDIIFGDGLTIFYFLASESNRIEPDHHESFY